MNEAPIIYFEIVWQSTKKWGINNNIGIIDAMIFATIILDVILIKLLFLGVIT